MLRKSTFALLAIASVLASTAAGEDFAKGRHNTSLNRRWNLSNTTLEYCVSKGKDGKAENDDYANDITIKSNSGDASVWEASKSGTGPFAQVVANDLISVINSDGERMERVVTSVSSDDQINVDLPLTVTDGTKFTWRHVVCSENPNDARFKVAGLKDVQLYAQVRQLSLESTDDGVEIHFKCQQEADYDLVEITDPFIITSAGVSVDSWLGRGIQLESYYACVIGAKLTGNDDATDTGTDAEQIELAFSGKREEQ